MELTVISAIHNEELCIELFLDRIKPILDSLDGIDAWKIVFVDDGSSDSSLDIIRVQAERDQRIKAISFSRNFGYQAALLAGLREIESDLYCIIDVDCEDPPEMLREFFGYIQKGQHLVYGIRSQRQEPSFVIWCRKMFYLINKSIADSNVYMWMAEFSMFKKTIRDAILLPNTTFPFLRTEMAYAGFKALGLPYLRQTRIAGVSHYNFLGMAKFAVGGILAGTTFPLRLILYISVATFLLFLLGCVFAGSLQSCAYYTIVLTFLYLITTMPLVGLYMARVYKNIVRRPDYLINREDSII